ncbi:MAG: manganese efflux pump [Paludibacteraceae bacterium]|nr:manganese efflux pump [Paludibacteraceae bacterium]
MMSLFDVVLLSIGLAMDCFSVSLACSMQSRKVCLKKVFFVAFIFGFFQGMMPVIGWSLGLFFKTYIEQFSGWIAFAILGFLGVKMIIEGVKQEPLDDKKNIFHSYKMLFLMAIATSIDAMASGIVFIPFGRQIWLASVVIALGSFLFSLLGISLGRVLKSFLPFRPEILGGSVLVLIGLKILFKI